MSNKPEPNLTLRTLARLHDAIITYSPGLCGFLMWVSDGSDLKPLGFYDVGEYSDGHNT